MAKAVCAQCDALISLDPDAEAGQAVACPSCHAALVLVTDGEYLSTRKAE